MFLTSKIETNLCDEESVIRGIFAIMLQEPFSDRLIRRDIKRNHRRRMRRHSVAIRQQIVGVAFSCRLIEVPRARKLPPIHSGRGPLEAH